MTTATGHPVQRWVGSICQQFSDATGWPLQFAPAGSPRAKHFESAAALGDSCWVGAVDDGADRLGFLFIELSKERQVDRAFLGACDLAAMVTELVSGQYAAVRRLEARSHQLATLVDVGMSLPSDDDLTTSLGRLLSAALKLTGFRSVGFFLLDHATDELRLRIDEHLEPRVVPHPLRTLKLSTFDLAALTAGKLVIRRETPGSAAVLPEDSQMAVCLPVQAKAGPMGTLWAFDRRAREPSDREVHVLQSIAVQIAAALERIVLLEESAVQQRLQRELKVASENQSQIAPPEHFRDPRLDAAAFCRSHQEVGGDLCEIIPLDGQRTLIAVGDAAGDSIPAALVMSAVRGSLRTLAADAIEEIIATDLFMARINEALYAITPPHQFMSLVVGVLDSDEGTLTYTNAGHPTPLIVHAGVPIPTTSHGMLLGVSPDTRYERSVVSVFEGDLIVLFSDGISEARNRARRMFRSDGILDAVKRHEGGNASSVLSGILAEFEAHTEGNGAGDDRTLLVVRLAPPVVGLE